MYREREQSTKNPNGACAHVIAIQSMRLCYAEWFSLFININLPPRFSHVRVFCVVFLIGIFNLGNNAFVNWRDVVNHVSSWIIATQFVRKRMRDLCKFFEKNDGKKRREKMCIKYLNAYLNRGNLLTFVVPIKQKLSRNLKR